jgi:REP element-mobilizing transposase RayT
MPRQVRIEFEGGLYHVMALGNQRNRIFASPDGGDESLFLETLGECCERSGFRIWSWVLMGNHYHLIIKTPSVNLVDGTRGSQTDSDCAAVTTSRGRSGNSQRGQGRNFHLRSRRGLWPSNEGCQNRKSFPDPVSLQDKILAHQSGTTVYAIKASVSKELTIPVPPLATQRAIVAEIEAEQALVSANRELITRFEQKIQATLARI